MSESANYFRNALRKVDEKLEILENTPFGEIVFIDRNIYNPPADLPSEDELYKWNNKWDTPGEFEKFLKIRGEWNKEEDIGTVFHYNGIAGILGTVLNTDDQINMNVFCERDTFHSEKRKLGIMVEYKNIPDIDPVYKGRFLSPYTVFYNFITKKARRFALEAYRGHNVIELTPDAKIHIGEEAEQELKRYDAEFGNDFHVWTRADEIRGLKAMGIL